MKQSKRKSNIDNLIYFMLSLSILFITMFPLIGKYGDSVQNTFIWITIIVCALLLLPRTGIYLNKFLLAYVFYIGFSVISLLWSRNLSGACTRIVDMTKVFLWGSIMVTYCQFNEDAEEKFMDTFVLGTVLISVFCIISDIGALFSWARLGRTIFENAGQNQIYYSCILIYASLILLFELFTYPQKRVLNTVLFSFLYICGILTAVRKCMIIPIVFMFIFVLLKYKKNVVKLIGFVILGVLFSCTVYLLILKYVPSMASRLLSFVADFNSSTSGSVSGDSYSMRKWLRIEAWNQFKTHPLLGVGIGQFRFYAADKGLNFYAHNNFLEILANTGLIGFLIYYGSLCIIICQALKKSLHEIGNHGEFGVAFLGAIFVMEYGQVDYYQIFFVIFPILLCNLVDKYRLRVLFGKQGLLK